MLASSQSSGTSEVPQRHGGSDPRVVIDLNDPEFQEFYWYCNRFRTQYAMKEGAD